jgi:hypothetical protein
MRGWIATVLAAAFLFPLPGAELRFQQPMRTNRTVTLVARGITDGTLRLVTITGREAANVPFTVGPSGVVRWRLDGYGLASGVYLVAAEWPGGRTTRLLLLLR